MSKKVDWNWKSILVIVLSSCAIVMFLLSLFNVDGERMLFASMGIALMCVANAINLFRHKGDKEESKGDKEVKPSESAETSESAE